MNPNMNPQQQQMYQRHLAQQNPQLQAQMRAQAQQHQQAMIRQRQMMAAQGYGMPGQQHLQPQFPQQQRHPSPMGQMPMGQPGQQNQMVGFGVMPPPSSGSPMGAMQPGMHPQQAFQQQQFMQAANAQFAGGMNPQMMSQSPIPQGTPSRPPSQMQMTPPTGQTPGTPTNGGGPNGMTPPTSQPQMGMQGGPTPPQSQQQQQHQQQLQQQLQLQQQKQTQQQLARGQNPSSPATNQAESNGDSQNDQSSQRVQIILELNAVLIKCILELQKKGKAGSTTAASTPTEASNPGNSEAQSPQSAQHPKQNVEWFQSMRRLQSNFSYLMGGNSAAAGGKRPLWPLQMDLFLAPPGAVIEESVYKQLKDIYQRLREAFPEYKPGLNPFTGQPVVNPAQMGQAAKTMGAMGPPSSQQSQLPKSLQQDNDNVATAS